MQTLYPCKSIARVTRQSLVPIIKATESAVQNIGSGIRFFTARALVLGLKSCQNSLKLKHK